MIYTKDLAFRLSGGAATYAFHIDQTGKVIHDYFGPALRDEVPLESLSKKMPTPGGTSVVYDEKKDPSKQTATSTILPTKGTKSLLPSPWPTASRPPTGRSRH